MGYLKYVKKLWLKPKKDNKELWTERLIQWRRELATTRIEHPTRMDRARSLGYKAKQGIFVVRQRVLRGGRQREQFKAGRNPKKMRRTKIVGKNYQQVCEERAQKKYLNCEVLNSYWVAQDGKYFWYEIIMVDPSSPTIKKDDHYKWMAKPANTKRALRGLTSAAKKSRGLRCKGKGAEKVRPGQRANSRLAK